MYICRGRGIFRLLLLTAGLLPALTSFQGSDLMVAGSSTQQQQLAQQRGPTMEVPFPCLSISSLSVCVCFRPSR